MPIQNESIVTSTQVAENKGTELTVSTTLATPLNTPKVRKIKAQADLLETYVSALGASYAPWLGTGYLRQLPTPTDDLMRDFGTRLYDEDMLRDPQVYSTLSVLVTAVFSEGVSLFPSVASDDPKYEQATKVMQFCDFNLKNLRHPIMSILYELCEGMLKMGHKVGEMEYDLQEDVTPGAGPQLVLTDILCKSNQATAFVVDGFNHVLGLLYIKPGSALPVVGSLLTGAADLNIPGSVFPAMLPRGKFIIPTHKPRNNDPRGTSHLKSVYTAWWKKQQLIPQHLAYVARFSQPSIWAKIPSDAKDIAIKDADGNISGYTSIVQATTAALTKVKAGAVAAFVDTDVELLEAKSDGKVLFDSFEYEDQQIAKGILFSTLATEQSQHQTRAAASVHQDTMGLLIAYVRSIMQWSIQQELLKPLVLYNYGKDAAANLLPEVSLGDTEQQDKPAMINSLAALALAGGIHPSQWPGIWRTLDFPRVNDKQWAMDQQILEANRENDLENATTPQSFQPPPQMIPGAGTPAGPTSAPPAGAAPNSPRAGAPPTPRQQQAKQSATVAPQKANQGNMTPAGRR